jgi:hypothetical protein
VHCLFAVARFETIKAIALALKLCIHVPHVPLGKSNSDQISIQSDSWFGHQGPKTVNIKSAVTPELMAGSSPIFYLGTFSKDTLHNTRVLDLTYFSRSEVKVRKNYKVGTFC